MSDNRVITDEMLYGDVEPEQEEGLDTIDGIILTVSGIIGWIVGVIFLNIVFPVPGTPAFVDAMFLVCVPSSGAFMITAFLISDYIRRGREEKREELEKENEEDITVTPSE